MCGVRAELLSASTTAGAALCLRRPSHGKQRVPGRARLGPLRRRRVPRAAAAAGRGAGADHPRAEPQHLRHLPRAPREAGRGGAAAALARARRARRRDARVRAAARERAAHLRPAVHGRARLLVPRARDVGGQRGAGAVARAARPRDGAGAAPLVPARHHVPVRLAQEPLPAPAARRALPHGVPRGGARGGAVRAAAARADRPADRRALRRDRRRDHAAAEADRGRRRRRDVRGRHGRDARGARADATERRQARRDDGAPRATLGGAIFAAQFWSTTLRRRNSRRAILAAQFSDPLRRHHSR